MTHSISIQNIFSELGLDFLSCNDSTAIAVHSPIDGALIGNVAGAQADEINNVIARAHLRAESWRNEPGPRRGAVVRSFGDLVRKHKSSLAQLITLETGKIVQESLGEVQEVVDICEFALGLSRQLYGLTIASERPDHKLLETWHPLGVVGVISAFNFPMAVFAWNAALALVCGNSLVWKPSEKTPFCAMALNGLLIKACTDEGLEALGLSELLTGGREVGEALVSHPHVRLVSATGSSAMGREVGVRCATHFKRALLELGGNNCAIVTPSANLDLVVRGVVFAAAGTAGQRCTSLRRLVVHRSIYAKLVPALVRAYERLPVGDPRIEGSLVGPLIDARAFENMQAALRRAQDLGATVHFGARESVHGEFGFYVRPALVEMPRQSGPMLQETFAPILYVTPYDDFEQAIALNNAVTHGLSSAVFTQDLREAELFTSARGSDCGIANVNIGTSGAEIGGAFGGEKETGGGRESGSDAWKSYMRRATNTVNYGTTLPLAQGVKFDI
jgi:aldehyde dehydrogenase (NAD+)